MKPSKEKQIEAKNRFMNLAFNYYNDVKKGIQNKTYDYYFHKHHQSPFNSKFLRMLLDYDKPSYSDFEKVYKQLQEYRREQYKRNKDKHKQEKQQSFVDFIEEMVDKREETIKEEQGPLLRDCTWEQIINECYRRGADEVRITVRQTIGYTQRDKVIWC